MPVNLSKPLAWDTPVPKFTLPLVITGYVASTAGVVAFIAGAIIGAAAVPGFLAITAAVALGGTICALIATSILRNHDKPLEVKVFEYELAQNNLDQAELHLKRIPEKTSHLGILYCRFANRLCDLKDFDRAIRVMNEPHRISPAVREAFIRQFVQKYNSVILPYDLLVHVTNMALKPQVKRAVLLDHCKFCLLYNRFLEAYGLAVLLAPDNNRRAFIEKLSLQTIGTAKIDEFYIRLGYGGVRELRAAIA